MGLLRYIINIPLLVALVWVLFDARPTVDGIAFSFLTEKQYIKVVPALFVFFLWGYVFARIDTWFSYYPLRRSLRLQKKENKALNKEHEKLNATVSGLKQNIGELQEKQSASVPALPKTETEKNTIGKMFSQLKNKFSAKKG